jgi:two-component system sensor histidine kinase TctE
MIPTAMSSGLQRRLLVLLIMPLVLLALLNAWFDYSSADSAAQQQDQGLLRLVPLLADSVVAPGIKPGDPPVLMLAPPVEEFLKGRPGFAAYSVVDIDGKLQHGEDWMAGFVPATSEPEFHSEENHGVTYRIVRQRVQTVAGELVLALADGSDPRQQWVRSVLLRVLLPNLVLIAAAAFAVNWAVKRALRPLLELKEAVEHRSPRDLNALDEQASPEEVRPLVHSLNRLFGLVNAQAESQRRFVADAAHQLRTPLAGLQAQVEAWAQAVNAAPPGGSHELHRPAGPAEKAQGAITLRADQIHKLRSATRRTSQLANQLLALSRADARSMEAQPMQRVDLKNLCEDMLEIHLDAATAKRIDLGLDAQPVQVMAGCCANCWPISWTTPSSTRRKAAPSPSAAAGVPAWKAARPSWRWRTTVRASCRPNCRACWSASTGCPAPPARATASDWRSPTRSPACTARSWSCKAAWAGAA